MRDQADKLRQLRLVKGQGNGDADETPRPSVRTIAVTGGKGGVGKSVLVTNLAIACARRGLRVLLVDGDLSLANLDLLMGLIPKKNLADVVLGQASIEETVLSTPSGVRFLPAASGMEEMADLDDFRRERLLRELSRLESSCDLILVDTAPGIGAQTTHLAAAAETALIVTTPEPTAFSDAYATLKVLRRKGCRDLALVVNRAGSNGEGTRTARRIQAVARRFLEYLPDYLGTVPEDPTVPASAMRQEPLLSIFPHSPAAQAIESLAEILLEGPSPAGPRLVDREGLFEKVANLDR
ncbi:MAG: MinD/ParA family protein [Candidatus Eisenbacteria bacterium]|uniref:MinD/ParA family protein n=1 Tax=Eiseniibacteriota bacterium TaxID=2212470 RepID=A0A956RR02_UNCEI|nr:MinD/ParA family protein [Candidatus Eisenbacteria bacterium]